jgi:hypothetical protein
MMSSDTTITLQAFLGAQALSDQQADIVWAGECLSKVKRELTDKVPGPFWSSARRTIDQALHGVLSLPIQNILGGAWSQYRSLLEYRDRKKHPPGEVALHPLMEHAIESSHKLQIEIVLNDYPMGAIDFEVTLALEIEMAILKIQDGKIREVEAGSCTGSGALMFGSAELFKRETSKLELPQVISFPNGVTI